MSAVLLAIELLLFEYRLRSIVPVALASVVACGVHVALAGSQTAFTMPMVGSPSGVALTIYISLGLVAGVASTVVTRAVYAVEDAFEKLPIHWMRWPAMGVVVVGVIGWLSPHTMGCLLRQHRPHSATSQTRVRATLETFSPPLTPRPLHLRPTKATVRPTTTRSSGIDQRPRRIEAADRKGIVARFS